MSVQQTGTNFDLEAKLCRGDELPTTTSYLTLSHCWGSTRFLTTTLADLGTFQISLPVDRLSKTFQDALFATVRLGFRYIWIDSLCIVQDDLEDWRRESLLMHKVYKNSSCNISASGFSDGTRGFCPNKRYINPGPVIVSLERQSPKSERSDVEVAPRTEYHLVCAYPWLGIRQSPIFLRAWTMQEQLLVRSPHEQKSTMRS